MIIQFIISFASLSGSRVPDPSERRPPPSERRSPRPGRRGARGSPRAARARPFSKMQFSKKIANFWRPRSRLYQNEILQENMRSTAFFKLYKICILLHRCNLKILVKHRFEISAISVKIENSANVAKSAQFCKISKLSAR